MFDPRWLIEDETSMDVAVPAGVRRGYVERDYTVQPKEMFAPPSQLALIPRSEWDARIEEQNALESSVKHLRDRAVGGRPMPFLDQNGKGYCHTADTEVLTDKGFVAWSEYNWKDLLGTVNRHTGLLEFQAPFEKHVYDYKGPMVHSVNGSVDFGVTPDHRMLVRPWDTKSGQLSAGYVFRRAEDLGWYSGLMSAPSGFAGTELVELEVPGDRRYDGDDFVALLSLIVSDGYAGGTDSAKNLVSFCCFRSDRRGAVGALAARLGFKESPSKPGVWHRWDAGALAAWVRSNCYTSPELRARNKKVPDLVKVASERQVKHFLSFYGDQNHEPGARTVFYSASKRLIDDLQELHLRIGKRSRVFDHPPGTAVIKSGENEGKVINSGPSHTLSVRADDELSLSRKRHIERDDYNGPVYCAAVPNETLVTRRKGTVLISGNCWTHSVTHTMMLSNVVAGNRYVPLSAYAVACKIKNFRDQGGWCGLAAEFARTHGVPSQAKWPQQSMSRAHDNDATWADAAKHKIDEDWVDLTRPVYYQNLTFDMVATCLLCNVPVAVDFNWWAHSVCAIRLVRVEAGSYGLEILNSWGGWGDNGTGVLRGSRAIPDGAVATRVVTPGR